MATFSFRYIKSWKSFFPRNINRIRTGMIYSSYPQVIRSKKGLYYHPFMKPRQQSSSSWSIDAVLNQNTLTAKQNFTQMRKHVPLSNSGDPAYFPLQKRNDSSITSAKELLSSFKEDKLVREETTVRGHLFILLLDKTKDWKKRANAKYSCWAW